MHVVEARILSTDSSYGYVARVEARSTFYCFTVKKIIDMVEDRPIFIRKGDSIAGDMKTDDFDKANKFVSGLIDLDYTLEIGLGNNGILYTTREDASEISSIITHVFKIIFQYMEE